MGAGKGRVRRSVIAVAAALVAAEAVARLLVPGPGLGVLADRPGLALYPGVERPEEVFSSFDHGCLQWSPYTHWVTRPNLRRRFFRTNSLGFRGPETPLRKPAGRFRIVVLGGSSAWGYGSTADERTAPGRLEAVLRERHPGRDLEVINAGQLGFVSGQELVYFHRVIAPLSPDLVLLLDGYNDVAADFANPVPDWPQNAVQLETRYEDFLRSGRLAEDVVSLVRQSRLLDLFRRHLSAAGSEGPFVPTIEPSETARSYVRNATALARLAAPAPVWVALQPVLPSIRKPLSPEEGRMLAEKEAGVRGYADRVRAAYAAIEAGVHAAGLPVIDLAPALGDEPRLLFADECHYGDEAASRIAAAIADAWARGDVLSVEGPVAAAEP